MASRQEARQQDSGPRLYLVTQPVDDATACARMLEPVLEAADIGALLLRLPETDERGQINAVKALAPLVQGRGIALLLDGAPGLVARAGADGAHLTGIDALEAAVAGLKPSRIAGAGGLHSRHDAMVAAEAGADYVMFGEPDRSGRRPPFPAIVERVEWWAEVFEVPCVGFAETADEVTALAQAGAEFIALCEFVWKDARGPVAAIASAAERLQAVELV